MRNFAPVIKNLFKIFIIGLLPLHMAASDTSELSDAFVADSLPDVTLEGVTVTAVKQGSDLSNQGIATTAMSRSTLEANNMLSPKAVTGAIPNV
ncbi:MAG: hypothetical protein II592_02575, partial [Muribaculaceae bacterium]|nr:hypothetical protein [Muribaculaceae bacterium]